jgi:hypothetical protein
LWNCQTDGGRGRSFENETLKLKWGNIHAGMRNNLMAVTSEDRQYVSILTDVHKHKRKATSIMNMGKLKTLPLLETFGMWATLTEWPKLASSYSFGLRTWKRPKHDFFIFSLVGSNYTEYLLHSVIPCNKIYCQIFYLTLVKNLLEMSARNPHSQFIRR